MPSSRRVPFASVKLDERSYSDVDQIQAHVDPRNQVCQNNAAESFDYFASPLYRSIAATQFGQRFRPDANEHVRSLIAGCQLANNFKTDAAALDQEVPVWEPTALSWLD